MNANQVEAVVTGLSKIRGAGRSPSQGARRILSLVREVQESRTLVLRRRLIVRLVDQISGATKASFSDLDEALLASSVAVVIKKAVAK